MQSIRTLLLKYNLLTKEVTFINSYVGILWCDADYVASKFLPNKKRTQRELALELRELIYKCNGNRKEFDYKTYEELTRIGMETLKFYGSKNNSWSDEPYDYTTDDDTAVLVRKL